MGTRSGPGSPRSSGTATGDGGDDSAGSDSSGYGSVLIVVVTVLAVVLQRVLGVGVVAGCCCW